MTDIKIPLFNIDQKGANAYPMLNGKHATSIELNDYFELLHDNRSLIAAAPEMYNALETAMNILNGDDNINDISSTDIESLLAKARGE